jgi:hypothetical protein
MPPNLLLREKPHQKVEKKPKNNGLSQINLRPRHNFGIILMDYEYTSNMKWSYFATFSMPGT